MPAPIVVSFAIKNSKEVEAAFASIEKRARKLAEVETRTARTSEAAARKRATASTAAANEEARAAQRIEKIKERSAIMAGKHAVRVANEEIRARKRAENAAVQSYRREAMAASKARMGALKGAAGAVSRAGRSTVGSVAGVAGGLGLTAGTAMVGQSIIGAARLRHQAMKLAQSTRGKDGKRTQDPAELMAFAQRMSTTHGVDASEVLSGLGTVAERAGGGEGLAKARKDWEALTRMGVAWSVSQEDMGGVVAAALDAGVQPGKELLDLVENLVAQGKLGAIEFGDLAGELGKLKGAGLSYDQSPASMLRSMVAFSQVAARAQVSPEESRTAVKDIGRDVTTNAEELRRSGVKTTSNGKLRNSFDLIADIIEKSETTGLYVKGRKGKQKGSLARDAMFTGTSSSIVRELANIYSTGHDGKTGRDAVMSALRAFEGAPLAKGETDAAYSEMMSTEVAKANVAWAKFNVELSKMLPQFSALLPEVLKATQAFAKLAVWASENPFKALGAVFAVHLTKELASAGIGNLIKNLLRGGGGGGAPGAPGGPGAAGALGNAAALAATGYLAYEGTYAAMTALDAPGTASGKANANWANERFWELQNVANAAKNKPMTEEDRERLRGWASHAREKAAQVAELESPSGINAVNPAAQLEAMTFRGNQGLAKSDEFNAVAAQLDALAGSIKTMNGAAVDASDKLSKLGDTASRSGTPPARK